MRDGRIRDESITEKSKFIDDFYSHLGLAFGA
jgi:hypothetical protein